MDEKKRLDVLQKSLEVIKSALTYKDLEISEGEMIKYNKHGQWSMAKEEPYWSTKSKMRQQKINREMDRPKATSTAQQKPATLHADSPYQAKPSTATKYVNIGGKGRGEPKKLDKEVGGGSLQGSYGMIS